VGPNNALCRQEDHAPEKSGVDTWGEDVPTLQPALTNACKTDPGKDAQLDRAQKLRKKPLTQMHLDFGQVSPPPPAPSPPPFSHSILF